MPNFSLRKAVSLGLALLFMSSVGVVQAQDTTKASSVYGTVVQDHVNVRSPSIESTLRKELERAGILVEKNTSIAQASAGVDKFALVGEKVIFDGSLSSVPAKSKNVKFDWDFGDGSSDEGLRVVHIYNRAGNYRANLTITVDGNVSRDEVVVSIYEKQAVLISGSSLDSEVLSGLNTKIRAEKTDLKSIRLGGKQPSLYMSADLLTRKLHQNYAALTKAEYIFSYDTLGLLALSRFMQQSDLDFSNVTVVMINPFDEVMAFQHRFVQLLYNHIQVKKIVIVPENFSYLQLLIHDYGSWTVLDEVDNGPGLLGVFSLVFRAFSSFLSMGISLQLLFFILAMILVTVLCLVAKRLVGFNSIDVFMSSLAILAILYLDVFPGLLMLGIFLILSFVIHSAFYVRQLVNLPWNVMKYAGMALMLLVGILMVNFIYDELLLQELFFPLLILAFVSDVMVYKMMNKPLMAVLIQLFQEVLLIVLVVLVASWTVLQQMMLGYPELYIFMMLIVGLLVEQYSGLRLSELSEFRGMVSADKKAT